MGDGGREGREGRNEGGESGEGEHGVKDGVKEEGRGEMEEGRQVGESIE